MRRRETCGVMVDVDTFSETLTSPAWWNTARRDAVRILFPKNGPTSVNDISDKIGIVICLTNRKPDASKELIMRHVLEGSLIHTDGFASYKGLEQLPVNPP
ncbi:hypothetical protein RF11_08486 [Thelohanellus kitauei]|uniref:ISXO2-like transposase domain-containing protein n=1 Tax=Thelohanellus kitauei TaxID=669202 RepID=A0A0C2JXC3_THEKT|nr:hypothetical protein RF11_08486 [Thelohanellus kitauei]